MHETDANRLSFSDRLCRVMDVEGIPLPSLTLSRRAAALLALSLLAVAAIVVGLVLLFGSVRAPVGPVETFEGDKAITYSRVSCGNALTGPHLTGIFTDIDPVNNGPGFFQTMADKACSKAKTSRRVGGWVLVAVGVLTLAGTSAVKIGAAKRGRHGTPSSPSTPATAAP
jgi:hypothetical protein